MTTSFEHEGFLVQITQNPIYKDYEFVVKTLDEKTIIGSNAKFVSSYEIAQEEAKNLIDDFKNK